MVPVAAILVLLIGLIPDEKQNLNLHSPPIGGSPRAAYELSVASAFDFTMREIPLTNSTRFALVDDDQFALVDGKPWYVDSRGNIAYGDRSSGKSVPVLMVSILYPCAPGLVRDHINHNRFDNRSCNIRICTRAENCRNMLPWRRAKSSRFKGVSWHKASSKWSAAVKFNRDRIYLGLFESEEAAAIAYNSAALHYFGQFAHLNVL